MPAPGSRPHRYEVYGHSRYDPPVVGMDDGLPQVGWFQRVQGPPQENSTYQDANPELPFFHKNDFTMWGEKYRS